MYGTTRVCDNFYPQGVNYSAGDLKKMIKAHFYRVKRIYLRKTKIKDVEIIGSRVWGQPKFSSDLDILVHYEGKTNPQDMKFLFAMSNTRLELDDIEIDVTFTKRAIEKWLKDSTDNLRPDDSDRAG